MTLVQLSHYAQKGPLYFYGGPLSSFAYRELLLPPAYLNAPEDAEPFHYYCREEYYAGAKGQDRETHDWIVAARHNTWKVKERGRDRARVKLRSDWDVGDGGHSYAVMLTAIRHELRTDQGLRQVIEATGDRLIAEDSPTDSIWGIQDKQGGLTGLNLLGLAWMQARAELRENHTAWAVGAHDRGWIANQHVLFAVFRTYSLSWLDADPTALRP